MKMLRASAWFQRCYFRKSGFSPMFIHPNRPFVFFLCWMDFGIALYTQVFCSLVFGLNPYSSTCIAKPCNVRARSHAQFGNKVALNANEIISCTEQQAASTWEVQSTRTHKKKNNIGIQKTYCNNNFSVLIFFVGEVIWKKKSSCCGFHKVFKRSKQ